jgi:Alpha-(1,6)-fucosyltransferase N- and catalytic domains
MSKIQINGIGGGIFSKFITSVQYVEALIGEHPVPEIYYNTVVDGVSVFDHVLDQTTDGIVGAYNSVFIRGYSGFSPIELSNEFLNLKRVIRAMKFKREFTELVESTTTKLGIDQNTVGVHIRLCDMNIAHGVDYGVASYDDYKKLLDEIMVDVKVKLFVASDNYESIEKLKKDYGEERIVYVEDMLRGATEIENTGNLQSQNLSTKRLWEEAFLDMILLSKCSQLICRTSNVVNISILFSDTIQNIVRIDESILEKRNVV